jgi:hypothetical protein
MPTRSGRRRGHVPEGNGALHGAGLEQRVGHPVGHVDERRLIGRVHVGKLSGGGHQRLAVALPDDVERDDCDPGGGKILLGHERAAHQSGRQAVGLRCRVHQHQLACDGARRGAEWW